MSENKKKVLITGVTSQGGAYLTEFLLNKIYEVHGLKDVRLLSILAVYHLYQDPH